MAAEQTQVDVEPLVSFVKTCAIPFLCATLHTNHQIANYPIVILGVMNSFFGAFSFGKWEGKKQGIILLFICILVPKCKYNFLCYFFVVTTKMNILIR